MHCLGDFYFLSRDQGGRLTPIKITVYTGSDEMISVSKYGPGYAGNVNWRSCKMTLVWLFLVTQCEGHSDIIGDTCVYLKQGFYFVGNAQFGFKSCPQSGFSPIIIKGTLLIIRVAIICRRNNRVLIVSCKEVLDIKAFHKAK